MSSEYGVLFSMESKPIVGPRELSDCQELITNMDATIHSFNQLLIPEDKGSPDAIIMNISQAMSKLTTFAKKHFNHAYSWGLTEIYSSWTDLFNGYRDYNHNNWAWIQSTETKRITGIIERLLKLEGQLEEINAKKSGANNRTEAR